MSKLRTAEVLENLNEMIGQIERGEVKSFLTIEVYPKLNIFDWWLDRMSLTNLKKMRVFVEEAIKLGYTGYCCFKVGATGCANGMWAYTKESENGYSPNDCPVIYKAFTPAYDYWSFSPDGNTFYPSRDEYDSLKTKKMFEEAHAKFYADKEVTV